MRELRVGDAEECKRLRVARRIEQHRSTFLRGRYKVDLTRSVVCFVDMLGYRAFTERVEAEDDLMIKEVMYGSLHAALVESVGRIQMSQVSHENAFKYKIFTDNIVIVWAMADDGEAQFSEMIEELAAFQLNMAINGFLTRGAVSVGNMFIDEHAIFGAALIEAYMGELGAIYPRVVLSRSAEDVFGRFSAYYSTGEENPFADLVWRDQDGRLFLNYLNSTMSEDAFPFVDRDLLKRHRCALDGPPESEFVALKRRAKESANVRRSVEGKLAWVRSYHDAFCDGLEGCADLKFERPPARFLPTFADDLGDDLPC